MTGGYLTLDFSDVEFKGSDDLAGFTLGYKKGITNYIKKTDKPIYLILSPSVMTALSKYCGTNSTIPSKGVYFLQPIFDTDTNITTSRHFTLFRKYDQTLSENLVAIPSLIISIYNDTVSISEL